MTEMITVSGNASDLAADSAFVSNLLNVQQVRSTRKQNEGSSLFYSKVLREELIPASSNAMAEASHSGKRVGKVPKSTKKRKERSLSSNSMHDQL